MKDAMLKAGLISKDSLERAEEKKRRERVERSGPAQKGVHQHHIRTDCGQCGKNSPDVEYYEHTNRSLKAKWLCVPCADKYWINDECRQTHQSSLAKSGRFLREFGATKKMVTSTGRS